LNVVCSFSAIFHDHLVYCDPKTFIGGADGMNAVLALHIIAMVAVKLQPSYSCAVQTSNLGGYAILL